MKTSKSLITVLRPNQLPMQDVVDLFLLDGRARNLAPKTIAFYRDQLAYFMRFWAGDITELSAETLRHYVIDMQERGYKGTSQHAGMRAIRAFLNWTVKQGYLRDSPMRYLDMPKMEHDVLPALSEDDVAALLDVCRSSRDSAIILCLLDSGLRAAEFVALNVGDYNKRNGEVLVRLGKGRKGRVSFFGPKARGELAKYLYSRGKYRDDDPLFISATGYRRLTVSGLETILERLGKKAAVHVSPHALRRTCALWCHRSGWSLESLRRLLGHSDFSVLRRYLALDTEDIQAAHNAAPPSGRLR